MRRIALSLAQRLPQPLKDFIHGHQRIDNFLRGIYGALVRSSGDLAVIASGPNAGLKLRVSEHTSHAHIRGAYELDVQEALARLVRPAMVCYDLGASIGYLTLLMARQARRVYAFEPSPVAVAEMRANLEANRFQHVEVIPHPVSDRRQSVPFAITDNAYGSGIARGETRWRTILVDAITLDEFALTHEPPDLIKIDIEGEEANALRGAARLLAETHPLICCELHGREAAEQVVEILTGHGYTVTHLDGSAFSIPAEIVPGNLQVIGLYKDTQNN